MLPAAYLPSDNGDASTRRGLSARTRSVSMSFPMDYPHSSEHQQYLVGFTGPLRSAKRSSQVEMSGPLYPNRNNEFVFKPPQIAAESENRAKNGDVGKNEHLLRSGQLGRCNDPYCTTCPMFYDDKGQQKPSRTTEMIDAKFRNMLYGDAQCWSKRMCSFLLSYIPGVMNPHAKLVQRWNKFFVVSCTIAAFLDPLFFFLLFVHKDYKCIQLIWPKTKAFLILRTMTDCVYFLHIILQFRLAYVAPESRVAGSGDLVDDPRMIAWHYCSKYFLIDLLVIIILGILRHPAGSLGTKLTKYLLPLAILLQYIPRLCRFLPLFAGFSPTGFTFESAWANFLMNLLTYILASHMVGSCWYLLSIQRVNQCLENACGWNKTSGWNETSNCMAFINCNHGHHLERFAANPHWELWKNNEKASACFLKDGFDFGICEAAVNLTTHRAILDRYLYSLFWGFQQISTLAGNQEPSPMHVEVVFTMLIIGIGLLLFALLIGNMQNFLLALGRRRLEKSLRGRDVEQWMSRRRLPKDLRRQVRASERFNWAATRGVNEDMLMENLPEDLQRDIRRHLFKFVKKVRIFQLLDEPVIDAIKEKLKTRSYIRSSKILYPGGLVDKIVFIIRGKMMSKGEDGNASILSEGDVCGEELLTWCLEHSSVSKDGTSIRLPRHRLLSNRLVTCLTNVEAFVLRAADFEEVTGLFTRFLKNPRIQGAIRYESPYWRGIAARRIQLAWRHKRKQTNRADSGRVDSSMSQRNLSSRTISRRR